MWNACGTCHVNVNALLPIKAAEGVEGVGYPEFWGSLDAAFGDKVSAASRRASKANRGANSIFRQRIQESKRIHWILCKLRVLPVIVSESEQELKMCNIWHLSQKHQCNVWFGLFPTDLAPQKHVWNAQNSGLLWRSAFPEKKSGLFCDPPNRKFFFILRCTHRCPQSQHRTFWHSKTASHRLVRSAGKLCLLGQRH